MTEERKAELNLTVQDSEISEQEDATDTNDAESQDQEDSKQEGVDISKEQKIKQINSYLSKVELGKITLEDAPHWMHDDLKKKLGQGEPKQDIDKIIEEKLSQKLIEKEEDAGFKKLEQEISNYGITADQKEELETEYNEFLELGLSPFKALNKAVKVSRVLTSSSNRALNVPNVYGASSNSKSSKSIYEMSDDELLNSIK
jgi:phage/plasmid-associated DNA primase